MTRIAHSPPKSPPKPTAGADLKSAEAELKKAEQAELAQLQAKEAAGNEKFSKQEKADPSKKKELGQEKAKFDGKLTAERSSLQGKFDHALKAFEALNATAPKSATKAPSTGGTSSGVGGGGAPSTGAGSGSVASSNTPGADLTSTAPMSIGVGGGFTNTLASVGAQQGKVYGEIQSAMTQTPDSQGMITVNGQQVNATAYLAMMQQEMSQLSEMMTTLSNIMQDQHQTNMNTIGNIKG